MSIQNTCPECGAPVVERTDGYGLVVCCTNCNWFTSWGQWDDCGGDPDKWKFDRLMEEAEAEATNPNN